MEGINYSLIIWNTDFSKIQNCQEYLVIFKDESGDRPSYYTEVAWRVHEQAGCWVCNNEAVFYKPLMWAKIPDYEDIRNG